MKEEGRDEHEIKKMGEVLQVDLYNFLRIKYCAADFALLNLPKGKILGRSKPATNSSNEQAH
jgi:hypothetical protein